MTLVGQAGANTSEIEAGGISLTRKKDRGMHRGYDGAIIIHFFSFFLFKYNSR